MQFFENRNYRVLAQVLFWGCLLGSVNLFIVDARLPKTFIYRSWVLIASVVFLVLWNVYYLVPRFFLKKNYGVYGLSVVVSVLILLLVASLLETVWPMDFPQRFGPLGPDRPAAIFPRMIYFLNPRNMINLAFYMAAITAGTVFESIQLHRKQELIAAQIQREKLEAEMKFLKSQINPHFLFNALNNVYSLSLTHSEHTSEVIMKLSEMLRYMLYESTQDRVYLCNEINYLENYVTLQQLKDDQPLAVQFRMNVTDQETQIAPMILIPFIENAFKHSKIEDTRNGWINISMMEKNGEILFKVTNSMVKFDYTKDPTGGIGLQNVRRRLELEYPDRHRLDIRRDETKFVIVLSISLS